VDLEKNLEICGLLCEKIKVITKVIIEMVKFRRNVAVEYI